ncbi:MAG TPA: glycosyltransferase family 1 protein, partial [Candidatus Methylomirabilis sp.]
NELARLLGLPLASFRVIPPGIELPPFAPLQAVGSDILHLSNGKPHKNIWGLIEAYASLPDSLQRQHPLVLAGIHHEWRRETERAIAHFTPTGQVRLEGFVDESSLPVLYSSAAMFAFPSLVEGFGIPPLEAMAHGVPVVASTGGALPETLGDAAVLVNPRDVRALSDALAAVLTDRNLRIRLVQAGRQRASLFSAERTGAALAGVVTEVLHGITTPCALEEPCS